MNPDIILENFEMLHLSLRRAAIPFHVNMTDKKSIEVTLYELIKSREQILEMIQHIDPARFGRRKEVRTVVITPEPSLDFLKLCPICGNPECTSDHK